MHRLHFTGSGQSCKHCSVSLANTDDPRFVVSYVALPLLPSELIRILLHGSLEAFAVVTVIAAMVEDDTANNELFLEALRRSTALRPKAIRKPPIQILHLTKLHMRCAKP